MYHNDDDEHLFDPAQLDAYAPDHMSREGPKTGIELSRAHAARILSRISPNCVIDSYRVSTRGYNNRLYYLTTVEDGACKEFVIKVCGRYWHRVKTETEVVGIWLAHENAHIPTPLVCDWDSDGKEFGVEYTVMPRLQGVSLDTVWERLDSEDRSSVIKQLASMIISFKSKDSVPEGSGKMIGNWIAHTSNTPEKPRRCRGFSVGPSLSGGGPWSSYKHYIRTCLENQLELAQKQPILRATGAAWPRVTKLLERLDDDEEIVNDSKLVFTHGDLDMQNILVERGSDEGRPLLVTCILDWEWSGMFPAEEEFFLSYGFIHVNENDTAIFYDLLEQGGVATPRTIPHFKQRKCLYDLKENLAPWFLLDVVDAESASVRKGKSKTQSCWLSKR